MFSIVQRVDKALDLFERLVVATETQVACYVEQHEYDQKIFRAMRKIEHETSTKYGNLAIQASMYQRISAFINLDTAWGKLFPGKIALDAALCDFAEEMSNYLEMEIEPPTLEQLDARADELDAIAEAKKNSQQKTC